MKKIISLMLVVLFCLNTGSFVQSVKAQDSIGVIINGRSIAFDVNPQIIDGRTMVPMRKIFEEMGAMVEFNASTQTITAIRENQTIIMQINSNEMTINGSAKTLDVAPTIIDSRTLVPVRAVADSFNATAEWNDNLKKVIIFDWDNVTKNVVSYDKYSTVPDFGKYVGLDSLKYEENGDKIQDGAPYYLYIAQLGTNAQAIVDDYVKVLGKNDFTAKGDYLYTKNDSVKHVIYVKTENGKSEGVFVPNAVKDDDNVYIYVAGNDNAVISLISKVGSSGSSLL